MTNPSDREELTPLDEHVDIEEVTAQPRPSKRRRRRGDTGEQPESDMMALPVVIATESLLMPHMTIPFPLDLDENALAVERAMRMNPRRVLVVSARPIDDDEEEGEHPREGSAALDLHEGIRLGLATGRRGAQQLHGVARAEAGAGDDG